VQYASAQSSTPVVYEDPDTGIIFDTWAASGITFGFAFPADGQTNDADEFIGYIVCSGNLILSVLATNDIFYSLAHPPLARALAGAVCRSVVP
jgi:hypothetical protein